MIRIAVFAAASLALAGCTYTPELMSRMDNLNVCRLAQSPLQAQVANAEAAHRGLDCSAYAQAVAEQERANNAMAIQMLGTMPIYTPPPPPAYQPPRAINCTSSRVGGTVFTNCN